MVKTFKLSKDPRFEEKLWNSIELYLEPPEKELVFCCDGKYTDAGFREIPAGLPYENVVVKLLLPRKKCPKKDCLSNISSNRLSNSKLTAQLRGKLKKIL